MTDRSIAREVAGRRLDAADPMGWFEDLYTLAQRDPSIVPWADLRPNPNLVEWLDRPGAPTCGPALKIGCGLGDDAHELAKRGFKTTAFDISEKAIAWSRERFPESDVSWVVADLFSAPDDWSGRYDFVLESYTLQVLPEDLRRPAMEQIASFLAPAGTVLVITRGRDPQDSPGQMPWPLTPDELTHFRQCDLEEISYEDYTDSEGPPVRRLRAAYRRRATA